MSPSSFADEGNNFVDEVILVLDVTGDAPARGNVAVVPALHVDGVDAKELQFAALNAFTDSADHVSIFELEEAAAGSGKDEDGQASMAEDEEFHVAVEPVGIPLVVLAVHGKGLAPGLVI